MNSKKEWLKDINFIFLNCTIFLIPFYKKFIGIAVILTLFSLLFSIRKETLKQKIYPLLITSLLFLAYIIGMLYTVNMDYGWFDIEIKLTLIILPLIFFLLPPLTQIHINQFIYSFISGCFFCVVFTFIYAYHNYNLTGDFNSFFYENLTFFFHPSYLAMFINFSLCLIVYLFYSLSLNRVSKVFLSFAFIVFCATIFFLSSKTNFFVLLLVLAFLVSIIVFYYKKYLFGVFFLLISCLSIYVLFKKVDFVSNRINTSFNNIVSKGESKETRIIIWQKAIQVIKSNYLFGVGTGDVKDALLNEYNKDNLNEELNQRLNYHNQYLQTTAAIGIMGVIIGLIYFVILILIFFIKKNWLALGFLIVISVNFTSESMLETQAGVVFFAFFNTLFIYLFFNKNYKNDSFFSPSN